VAAARQIVRAQARACLGQSITIEIGPNRKNPQKLLRSGLFQFFLRTRAA